MQSTITATAEQSFSQACALVEINERAVLLPALPAEIDDSDLFQFHGVHVQPIPLEDLQGMTHVLFGSLLLGERMDTPQSTAQIMRIIASLYNTLDTLIGSVTENGDNKENAVSRCGEDGNE